MSAITFRSVLITLVVSWHRGPLVVAADRLAGDGGTLVLCGTGPGRAVRDLWPCQD